MTLELTHEAASAGILAHVEEGRLVQAAWHRKDNQGRELACLLGSMHPKLEDVDSCPAELMPRWAANLTVVLFDRLPVSRIGPVARRYGESVSRWGALDARGWEGLRTGFVNRAIDLAVEELRAIRPAPPEDYLIRAQALLERLRTLILERAPYSKFRTLRDDAETLRDDAETLRAEAWRLWREARAGEAAEAEAVAAAVAAVAAAVAAAEAAEAVEAVAAAVAAAEAAEAVEAVAAAVAAAEAAEAARARMADKLFDVFLSAIHAELQVAA